MKVHLIKGIEVSKERFTRVVTLLESVPGLIKFTYSADAIVQFTEEDLYEHTIVDAADFVEKKLVNYALKPGREVFPLIRETASWETLFKKCTDYRVRKSIPLNEFVLLLTDIPNSGNWFAALDSNMPFNGFIHTADWSSFISCSETFPVAYEVIALLLQQHLFQDKAAAQLMVHQNPIGCINDFCANKREIILKLRTADICSTCLEKMKTNISIPILHHALALMESFRVKMLYAQNFKQESPLSRLIINEQHKIFLIDFENIEIKLTPLEKSLYLLFLKYPEGIYLSDLSEHRKELYAIYTQLSSLGMLKEMQLRIDDMVNALSDSASIKISKIKKAFENAIGNELAKNYYIKGANGAVKKIDLDRKKIIIQNNLTDEY